jgi:DNA-binding CsgD family transcriptional regulator
VADRRPVAVTWLDMQIAETAFDVGEWELAERSLPGRQHRIGEQSRVGIGLLRAALALGRGDHAAAGELLRGIEPLGADSSEPQVIGALGATAAELRRREGDLEAARTAVDEGLERIRFCSDDVVGGAALAETGVTVEADAAERARDLGEAATESAAVRRADDLLARVVAAATTTRPVERARLAGARAEAGRAAGRPDPDAYAHAATAWDEVGRPEPAAQMRWRQAEVLAATGDRDAAAEPARAAHVAAARIGAAWLRGEIEALAARARLALELDGAGPDRAEPEDGDAFGLTARERQVLALLAEGATNREIGATLFIAEKTASVHVSRILTKLGARSRTEAAAVAHRHRLTEPGG